MLGGSVTVLYVHWILTLILIQIYSAQSRASGIEFFFLHAASPHPRQLLMGCSSY